MHLGVKISVTMQYTHIDNRGLLLVYIDYRRSNMNTQDSAASFIQWLHLAGKVLLPLS